MTTSYVVDAEAVVTRVTVTATLTHTRPDQGNRYWYFDSYPLPIPAEATGITATVDGTPAEVATEAVPELRWAEHATVPLRPALRYRDVRTVTLSYQLGTQPARADAWSQANKAFFMFPVWPVGDPGRSDVEVTIPDNYDIDVIGDTLQRQRAGDRTLLSARQIPSPLDFVSMVLASDDSRLVTEVAETSAGTVELEAWPDHAEWVDFVVGNVDRGVPVLSELLGQPWPRDRDNLTIVETMTPFAQGYGGWYDAGEHEIMIGDQLDGHLVLHELAHVWLNFDLFEERWLLEGFADEYADRATRALGLTTTASRPTAEQVAETAIPLSQWSAPAGPDRGDRTIETYGYEAAWYVIGSIVNEIGIDATRDILAIAAAGEITYGGDPDREDLGEPTDWRRMLDLFENVGRSRQALGLFDDYVVSPAQQDELADRAEARARYRALAERGGEWTPPLEVREHMASWSFDSAAGAMDAAATALDRRGELEDTFARLGISASGLERRYETASDTAALTVRMEDTLDAAASYSDVARRWERHEGDLLTTVGLWGADVDAQLDGARLGLRTGRPAPAEDLARRAAVQLDGARHRGLVRTAGTVLLAAGGLAVLLFYHRSRTGRPPGPPRPSRDVERPAGPWPLGPPSRPDPLDRARQPVPGGAGAPSGSAAQADVAGSHG